MEENDEKGHKNTENQTNQIITLDLYSLYVRERDNVEYSFIVFGSQE